MITLATSSFNSRQLFATSVLATLGLLAMAVNIPLSFGMDFLFGSIFIFVALQRLGLASGLLVALIVGSYTLVLWNHSYGLLALLVETLFVGIAIRRNPNRNLPAWVMIYWLVIGLTLMPNIYHFMLGLPWEASLLVAFKQAVNGVFNALIATLIIQFLPCHWLFGAAPKRLYPLQHTQTNLLVAFAFMSALLIIILSAKQTVENSKAAIAQRVTARSAYISAQIMIWQNENIQMLNSLGQRGSMISLHDLQLFQQANPDLLFLHRVDPHGKITLSTVTNSAMTNKIDFSDRGWFRTLLATNQPVFSDALVGRTSGLATIAMAAPILDGTRLSGMMLTSIKPQALLDRVTAGNSLLGTRITLVDRKGVIIVSTEPSFKPMQAFEQARGGKINERDGALYRWAPLKAASAMQSWAASYYAQDTALSQSGWRVVIEQPLQPYAQALVHEHLINFIFTFLLAIAAFLLGSRAGKLVSRPLHQLSQATAKLSRDIGSQAPLELPNTGVAEIAALSDDFQRMAQTLRNYYAELTQARDGLEQRVTERTAELQQAEQSLRESKQLVESVIENVPAMIFMKRAEDLRFVLFNKAGENLLGIPRTELLGKNDYDLFPQQQADFFVAKDRAVLTSGFEDIPEETIDTKMLGQRVLHTRKIALRDHAGKPQFLLGISHDITERKQTESQLIKAKEEAEQANQAKSDFLSSMSHELRTPMNGILGFAQLLEFDQGLRQDQQDSVQEILRAGQHLLVLIDEVLDLARVESGNLSLSIEPVTCQELLDEVMSLIQPLCAQKDITPQLRTDGFAQCSVQADRTRLRQVLLNLLSNAIKYNRDHGQVTLALSQEDETIRFNVRDTGTGIPPERQAELFQAFNRLGAERGHVQGTGIGLVISKQIVETMGGSIGFRSTPGIGSEFWIDMPIAELRAQAQADEQPLPVANTASSITGTILYVEDNPSNLRLMANLIGKRPGLHLITAHEPNLGIDLARAHHPDVILLDINLPGMDGFEVLRILRADPLLAGKPIVAVSANAMEKDIQKGKSAGFDDYVTKPINIDAFLQTLDRLFTK